MVGIERRIYVAIGDDLDHQENYDNVDNHDDDDNGDYGCLWLKRGLCQ